MMFARGAMLMMLTAAPALAFAAAPPRASGPRPDAGQAAGGQAARTPPADEARAQAQFEFLMARRLEAAGDMPGALAALERARKLDPMSAELSAELAGFYSRQNRLIDAVVVAEQALKLDKNNVEAHNVLGLVYVAWADGAVPLPPGHTQAAARASAIEHLSAIQSSPLMTTNPNLQMTLGRLYLRSGKTEVAVPILEKVAQQAPWAPEPLALLYEAQVALGRLDEAAASLSSAAELNPRYWAQLGQFYERQDKWEEAASAYEAAISNARQPNRDVQIRYAAALINTESGAGKARGVLNELLKATPNDTRVLYLLSMAERTDGDLEAAEATARRIVSIEPNSVTGLRALVSALFDRYDYRQVVEVVTPLLKDPARAKGREMEGAAVLVQLGIAQQQLARWDDAIAAYTTAKTLTPRDADIDAYLVQAHLTARRFDRAEAIAREALTREPNQPRMVRLRAQALLKGGKAQEANRLLEEGAAKNPDNREFVIGLADLYADQKRTDDAVRLLEQARRTFGDDDSIAMRLATVYESAGKLDDAEKELRRLMAEDPLNADALNSLGYMLADRGLRLPEAIELAERAVKIEPDNPAYLDTLGWALFKHGRVDEAAAPLGRAATTLTGNSVIQDHHGDLLARRGQMAEAIAAWQRALAGDGEQIDRAVIEKKIRDAKAKQGK